MFLIINLGAAYGRQGMPREAAVHLGDALAQDPDFVPALVSLALIRATSPDRALRDGRQAVELAARACQLTDQQHAEALYALAAAYAEAGQVQTAVSVAERALQVALAQGNQGTAAAIRQQIELLRGSMSP